MTETAFSASGLRLRAGAQPSPAAIGPGFAAAWRLDGERPGRAARGTVARILGCLGTSRSGRDDAELAVQELAVNACQYAPGPRELRIRVSWRAVMIAVADSGDGHAALARDLARAGAREPSLDPRGRGLQIVSALFPGACGAAPGGTGPGGSGTQVWISVALEDR